MSPVLSKWFQAASRRGFNARCGRSSRLSVQSSKRLLGLSKQIALCCNHLLRHLQQPDLLSVRNGVLFERDRIDAHQPAVESTPDQPSESLPAWARVIVGYKVAAGADSNQGRAAFHVAHRSHSIV